MSDKYDDAIAYLTQHPTDIPEAWANPGRHQAGCLFQMAARGYYHSHFRSGCLTMIRPPPAEWVRDTPFQVVCADRELADRLTDEIRQDTRIPWNSKNIKVSDLPVFAEWQRRLDWQLRTVPQLSDDDLAKLIITKAKLDLCSLPSPARRIAAMIAVPVSMALALLVGWPW